MATTLYPSIYMDISISLPHPGLYQRMWQKWHVFWLRTAKRVWKFPSKQKLLTKMVDLTTLVFALFYDADRSGIIDCLC